MEILFLQFFSASGPFIELACFVWRLKTCFLDRLASFASLNVIILDCLKTGVN